MSSAVSNKVGHDAWCKVPPGDTNLWSHTQTPDTASPGDVGYTSAVITASAPQQSALQDMNPARGIDARVETTTMAQQVTTTSKDKPFLQRCLRVGRRFPVPGRPLKRQRTKVHTFFDDDGSPATPATKASAASAATSTAATATNQQPNQDKQAHMTTRLQVGGLELPMELVSAVQLQVQLPRTPHAESGSAGTVSRRIPPTNMHTRTAMRTWSAVQVHTSLLHVFVHKYSIMYSPNTKHRWLPGMGGIKTPTSTSTTFQVHSTRLCSPPHLFTPLPAFTSHPSLSFSVPCQYRAIGDTMVTFPKTSTPPFADSWCGSVATSGLCTHTGVSSAWLWTTGLVGCWGRC